jgi:hypothetical protein
MWSRDGRTIYFTDRDRILAVDVGEGDQLAPGRPRVFLQGVFDTGTYEHNYAVTADGTRAVVVSTMGAEEEQAELRVVLGWGTEVRQLMAGN